MCLRRENAAVCCRMMIFAHAKESKCNASLVPCFFAYANRNAGDAFAYGAQRTERETKQSMNMSLDAAGIPRVLAQQLP